MHILLVPDSFKDSISATDIVAQLELGFSEIDATLTTESCIASDGGEGFLTFVQRYVAVMMIPVQTVDPLGRGIVAEYAFAKATKTAYIELARASGLELLSAQERTPLLTSTYGTGLQIKDAIDRGAQEIYVGLGGSATNDGGTGMAAAMGYEFLDERGSVLETKGGMLSEIAHIRKPEDLVLPNIFAVNDVDNILVGRQGAAFTYGKQKGATLEEIYDLDKGLRDLSGVVLRELKINEVNTAGTGAAGGSGYGLKTFFNALFIPGVSFLAILSGIEKSLASGNIDFIVTGEGSIDEQTSRGKLVKGIATLGKRYNIPVMAICGVNALGVSATKALGIEKVFAVADMASSKQDSIKNAGGYVRQLSRKLYTYYLSR